MKKILFFIFCLSLVSTLFAQTIQNVPIINIPSPNAQALGVFGQYPQSDFAGVPSINVPIYTLKLRDITMPISLNYNSNLVKPDSHPGWVGLGWNLSSGGAITRVICDKPDDEKFYDYFTYDLTGNQSVGFYYNFNALAGSDWYTASRIQTLTTDWLPYWNNASRSNSHPESYYFRVTTPAIIGDYKPDEFSFNFLNFSGTFYLDENRNWKIRSDQHIKVVEHTDNAGHFNQFVITDNTGIQYVFGGPEASIEYVTPMGSYDVAPHEAKTWNLTKVILLNGETISLNYERGDVITALEPTSYLTPDPSSGNPTNSQFNYSSGFSIAGSEIEPAYLKSIQTKNQTILFSRSLSVEMPYQDGSLWYENNLIAARAIAHYSSIQSLLDGNSPDYNPGAVDSYFSGMFFVPQLSPRSVNDFHWAQLNSVQIFDNAGILNDKYEFSYSSSNTERLRLIKMVRKSPINDIDAETFSFEYNSTMLPRYLSLQTDFWGFYNGKSFDPTNLANFQASRQPDPIAGKAQLLSKIIYPTGGYTTYDFEQNKYATEVDFPFIKPLIDYASDQPTGGMRIAQITNYSSTNVMSDYVRYFYDHDHFTSSTHLSSGVLASKRFFVVSPKSFNSDNSVGYASFVTNFPGASNNNGGHVGYSEVTEQHADGSFITTKFSNFENGSNREYMDENAVLTLKDQQDITSHAFERGKMLQKTVYDVQGNKLKDQMISYSRINPGDFVRYVDTRSTLTCKKCVPALNPDYGGESYKMLTYSYLPVQEINVVYQNPSAPASSKTVSYTYDNATLNIKGTNSQNSKGEIEEVVNYYPQDMVDQGNDPDGVYLRMVAANYVSPVVQAQKKINAVTIETRTTSYKDDAVTNQFNPNSQSVQYLNGPLKTLIIYPDHDEYQNLLTAVKPGGAPDGYLYGYDSTLPIAKVNNVGQNKMPSYSSSLILLPFGDSQAHALNFNIPASGAVGNTTIRYKYNTPSNTIDGSQVYCVINGSNGFVQKFMLYQGLGNTSAQIQSSKVFFNLPPGQYSISSQIFSKTNLTVDMAVEITFPQVSKTDIYLENFENRGVVGNAHTGNKFNNGAFSINFVPYSSGQFVLDYFYRVNNIWKFSRGPYNGPTSILPVGADAVDDVRVYPANSQISTFTYDLLAGMTSVIDSKGETNYYEYDQFHRLYRISDKYRNVIKQICYNFAGQATNCAVTITLPSVGPTNQPTIYARVEGSNSYTVNTGPPPYNDGNQDDHINLYIRLYLNPDCTIPYTLNTDLDIFMQIQQTLYNRDQYGNENYNTSSYAPYYTITNGNSELYIGDVITNSRSATLDSYTGNSIIQNFSNSYVIVGGSANNYVPTATYGVF